MSLRQDILDKIADLQKQLDAIPERLVEPCRPDSDVWDRIRPITVKWYMRYARVPNGYAQRPYTYLAARIEGKWFVTGHDTPQNVTWTELWDWIEARGGLAPNTSMSCATGWRDVT